MGKRDASKKAAKYDATAGTGSSDEIISDRRKKQAAQLENMQKMRANLVREKRIEFGLKVGGYFGAALMVVLLGYAIATSLKEHDVVTRLEVDSPEVLQSVFFGGQGWLILCSDSRKALKADGTIRETYFEAAKLLTDSEFMQSKDRSVDAAVLDCSASLPSGKTTYERLGLNATRTPVMFLSIGGDKPKQLSPKLLKTPKAAKRKRTKKGEALPPAPPASEFGKPLAAEVKKLFIKRYQVQEIRDGKQLLTRCIERKQCALIFGAGPLGKPAKNLAAQARRAKPLLRWAYVDIGGTGYSINVWKELMAGNEPDSFGANALRLVVFKEKRFKTMPQTERYPAIKQYRYFLNQALEEGSAEMAILKKIPALSRKSKSKLSNKQKPPPLQKQAKRPETASSEPEGEALTPEEARAAQLKREQARRAAMEEEAKLYEPAFDSSGEDGEEDDEEFEVDEDEDDQDEDEIELD